MRDPEAAPLLDALPEEEKFATWHLALRDGTVVGYGTGGRELAGAMRLTRPFARLIAHLPDNVLERAYRLIARQRSPLGRLVPDGPAPRRFP